jgi:glutathione S-transferase kappa 1
MRRIELFYDVVSPYSRLALVVLERYVGSRWPDVELVMRPAFLGGVMKAVGNVPPATLPQRAPYLMRDLGRLTGYVGVSLVIPEDFPGNTLSAMRFLTVVAAERPDLHARAAHALFERHWGEGKSVASTDAILAALDAAGLPRSDVEPLLARVGDADVKERLKQATDEVVARGAFGFPAMFTTIDGNDEMFFGHDRISLLAHEMKLTWLGPRP